jgi:hypothetical protein
VFALRDGLTTRRKFQLDVSISTNVTHPQAQVENVEAMLSVAILLEDSLALASPGSQEIRLSTAMILMNVWTGPRVVEKLSAEMHLEHSNAHARTENLLTV